MLVLLITQGYFESLWDKKFKGNRTVKYVFKGLLNRTSEDPGAPEPTYFAAPLKGFTNYIFM